MMGARCACAWHLAVLALVAVVLCGLPRARADAVELKACLPEGELNTIPQNFDRDNGVLRLQWDSWPTSQVYASPDPHPCMGAALMLTLCAPRWCPDYNCYRRDHPARETGLQSRAR